MTTKTEKTAKTKVSKELASFEKLAKAAKDGKVTIVKVKAGTKIEGFEVKPYEHVQVVNGKTVIVYVWDTREITAITEPGKKTVEAILASGIKKVKDNKKPLVSTDATIVTTIEALTQKL